MDPSTSAAIDHQMINTMMEDMCPGFCGHVFNSSMCEACPWGSRVESGALCTACDSPIEFYAWLYLLLVALAPCMINCLHVRRSAQRAYSRSTFRDELPEHVCIVIECTLAAIGAVLVFEPFGSFQLHGCRATRFKQWYTWMHNPTVRFAKTMPCAHEVVYPLQSLPIVYLGLCLVNTLILRSTLYAVYVRKHRTARSYYASLFTLPLVGVVNVLVSGLIYHVFPYVIGLYSLGGQSLLFSYLKPISRKDLWKKAVKTPKEMTHILVLMAMFAFSIVAVLVRGGSTDWMVILGFLSLVFAPPIFFSLTTVLTHPLAVVEHGMT